MKRIYMLDENNGVWECGNTSRKGIDLYKVAMQKKGIEREFKQKLKVFIEDDNKSKDITSMIEQAYEG